MIRLNFDVGGGKEASTLCIFWLMYGFIDGFFFLVGVHVLLSGKIPVVSFDITNLFSVPGNFLQCMMMPSKFHPMQGKEGALISFCFIYLRGYLF